MTSLDFGPLLLGGNVFGWTADRQTSFRVLDAFVAAGGTTIDTADVYSAWIPGNQGGESETILGEWLAGSGKRDSVLIATKVGKWAPHPGLSRANVEASIEGSLHRLQTDHVDLYFAHADDESVPQEEYVAAFDSLVKAGKAREVGVSNFTAGRVRSAVELARQEGLTPFTVSEDQYNLVERGYETELAPTIAELGLVQTPYYALASGFLTGKYAAGSNPKSQRSGDAAAYLSNPRNVQLLSDLKDVAAGHRVSEAAVALAWLRAQPTVAAPIASARIPEQLPALVESFELRLTDDEVRQLSSVTAPAS